MKNQPGALKKMLASKVTTANDPAINSNKKQQSLLLCNQPAATKPLTEQKENNTNEKIEAALQENWSKLDDTKSSCSKSTTNNIPTAHTVASSSDPKNAKKRKLLNAIKPDYVNLYECEVETCESCCGENKAQSAASVKSMVEQFQALAETTTSTMDHRHKVSQMFADESASLDDILEFIEGNSTTKKDSQKKAAKKAKQKQKKEDVKRFEELEQLRDQFHEVFFKESDVKNELKNLRSMKKRDKKKIAELETSIKKYGKFKCKIESNILELIVALKANSPEFKFAYLPSKELLEKQSTQNNGTPVIAASAEQAKIQTEKSNNVQIIQNDQRQGDSQHQHNHQQQQQQSCELSLDQSKRMVTIRRINIPHAEPQVTVTAKGISPDKDKLLYTFINGQLIPSANVPNASCSNQSGSNEKLDKTAKTKQALKATAETAPNSSKTNKKQTESQNVIEKTAKKNAKDKSTEKAKPTEKNTGRKTPPDNAKPSISVESNGKKSTTVVNNKAAKTTANNAVKEKDKQKKKSKKDEDVDVENVAELTKNLTLSEEQPKKQKKKVKAVKYEYADPNYKVNQFNLLDDDEDGDDYYLESSSDESIDEPVPVKLTAFVSQTPTASVQVTTTDSQASQLSKNNNKNKGKDKNAKNQPDTAKKAKNDANSNAKTTNNTTTGAVTKIDKKSSSESNKSAAKPSNVAQAQVVTPKLASIETVTSKKQKKKAAQKQQNQTQVQAQLQPHQPTLVRSKSSVEKVTPKGDNAVNSLNKSMQRMQLNSDTTIEPVNNTNHTANKVCSSFKYLVNVI